MPAAWRDKVGQHDRRGFNYNYHDTEAARGKPHFDPRPVVSGSAISEQWSHMGNPRCQAWKPCACFLGVQSSWGGDRNTCARGHRRCWVKIQLSVLPCSTQASAPLPRGNLPIPAPLSSAPDPMLLPLPSGACWLPSGLTRSRLPQASAG